MGVHDDKTGPNSVSDCGGKFWPISKSTCPFECLYGEILGNIDLGIIVFGGDPGSEQVTKGSSFEIQIPLDKNGYEIAKEIPEEL